MKILTSSINTCPSGLQWDNVNFCCAYDALFSVLLDVWSRNSNEWSTFFKSVNKYMVMLADGFQMHAHERISLEAVRDGIRAHLKSKDSGMFPMGSVGTRVADLAHIMLFTSVPVAEIDIKCMGLGCHTPHTDQVLLQEFWAGFCLWRHPGNSTAVMLHSSETFTLKRFQGYLFFMFLILL